MSLSQSRSERSGEVLDPAGNQTIEEYYTGSWKICPKKVVYINLAEGRYGFLWTRQYTFGFHQIEAMSWLAQRL